MPALGALNGLVMAMAGLTAAGSLGLFGYTAVEVADIKDDIDTNQAQFDTQITNCSTIERVNPVSLANETVLQCFSKAGVMVSESGDLRSSAQGVSCFDLNANGACDLATEDLNGDGACTVADCFNQMASDYVFCAMSADQAGVAPGTTVNFAAPSVSSTLQAAITPAAPSMALAPGHTYEIMAQVVSATVGTEIDYAIYDQTGTAIIGVSASSISVSVAAPALTGTPQSSSVAYAMVTPSVASSVNVRVQAVSGAPTIDASKSWFRVRQISGNAVGAFNGATAGVAGAAGYVPAPAAGDQGKYLSGAGTWDAVAATLITDGLGSPTSLDTAGTALTATVNSVPAMLIDGSGTTVEPRGGGAGQGAQLNLRATTGFSVSLRVDQAQAINTVYTLPTVAPTASTPVLLGDAAGVLTWGALPALGDTDGDAQIGWASDDVLTLTGPSNTHLRVDATATPTASVLWDQLSTWTASGVSKTETWTALSTSTATEHQFMHPTGATAGVLAIGDGSANWLKIAAGNAMATDYTIVMPNAQSSGAGQMLISDGGGATATMSWGYPARQQDVDSDTWVDTTYNILGGVSGADTDYVTVQGSSLNILSDVVSTNPAPLKFYEAAGNGLNAVSFQAPTSLAADVVMTLPDAQGGAGTAFVNDGTGALSFGFTEAIATNAVLSSETAISVSNTANKIESWANGRVAFSVDGTVGGAVVDYLFDNGGNMQTNVANFDVAAATSAEFDSPYLGLKRSVGGSVASLRLYEDSANGAQWVAMGMKAADDITASYTINLPADNAPAAGYVLQASARTASDVDLEWSAVSSSEISETAGLTTSLSVIAAADHITGTAGGIAGIDFDGSSGTTIAYAFGMGSTFSVDAATSVNLNTPFLALNPGGTDAELRLYETAAAGGNYIAFKPHAAMGSDYTLTMPDAVGAAGQTLVATDGAGNLGWTYPGRIEDGAGSPAFIDAGLATPQVIAAGVNTYSAFTLDGTGAALVGTFGNKDALSTMTTNAGAMITLDAPVLSVQHSTTGGGEAQAELRFYEDADSGTNYAALRAAGSMSADVTWTLPAADGALDQVLATDGAGGLQWRTTAVAAPSAITPDAGANEARVAGDAFNVKLNSNANGDNLLLDDSDAKLTLGRSSAGVRMTVALESDGAGAGNFVNIATPAGLAASYNLELPVDAGGGVDGLSLQTNGAGVLSWGRPTELDDGTGTGEAVRVDHPADGSVTIISGGKDVLVSALNANAPTIDVMGGGTDAGTLRLFNAASDQSVGFKVPAALTGTHVYTLPDATADAPVVGESMRVATTAAGATTLEFSLPTILSDAAVDPTSVTVATDLITVLVDNIEAIRVDGGTTNTPTVTFGAGSASASTLVLAEQTTNGVLTTTLKAAADITAAYTVTLPAAGPGAAGDILQDSDGAGTLVWATPPASTTVDADSDTGLTFGTADDDALVVKSAGNNVLTSLAGANTLLFGGLGDIVAESPATKTLKVQNTDASTSGSLYFMDNDSSNGVGLEAPAIVAADHKVVLPAATSAAKGYAFVSQDAAGTLDWGMPSGLADTVATTFVKTEAAVGTQDNILIAQAEDATNTFELRGVSAAANPGIATLTASDKFVVSVAGADGMEVSASAAGAALSLKNTAGGGSDVGEVKLFVDASGTATDYVSLKAPNALGVPATPVEYTLPAAQPTAGHVLTASAPVAGAVSLSWTPKEAGLVYSSPATRTNTAAVAASGTGPGGVAPHLWLQANKAVFATTDSSTPQTVSGNNVQSWESDLNAAYRVTKTGATDTGIPTWLEVDPVAGYASMVKFQSTTQLVDVNSDSFWVAGSSTGRTVFYVGYIDADPGATIYPFESGPFTNNLATGIRFTTGNVLQYVDGADNSPIYTPSAHRILNAPVIAGCVIDNTQTDELRCGVNGYVNTTGNLYPVGDLPDHAGLAHVSSIGSFSNGDNDWLGGIGEVITFDSALSEADHDKVTMYLAMKYGLPYDGRDWATSSNRKDLTLSDGTTVVWPYSTEATYKKDVFGLVRDDASGLHRVIGGAADALYPVVACYGQCDPNDPTTFQNINADGDFIFFGAADDITRDFMYMGHKGWATNYVWTVKTDGGAHTVTIGYDTASNPSMEGFDTVLVDTVSTFDSGSLKYYQMSTTGTYSYATITLNDGEFINFGLSTKFGSDDRWEVILATDQVDIPLSDECNDVVRLYSRYAVASNDEWRAVAMDDILAADTTGVVVKVRNTNARTALPGMPGARMDVLFTRDELTAGEDDYFLVHCKTANDL